MDTLQKHIWVFLKSVSVKIKVWWHTTFNQPSEEKMIPHTTGFPDLSTIRRNLSCLQRVILSSPNRCTQKIVCDVFERVQQTLESMIHSPHILPDKSIIAGKVFYQHQHAQFKHDSHNTSEQHFVVTKLKSSTSFYKTISKYEYFSELVVCCVEMYLSVPSVTFVPSPDDDFPRAIQQDTGKEVYPGEKLFEVNHRCLPFFTGSKEKDRFNYTDAGSSYSPSSSNTCTRTGSSYFVRKRDDYTKASPHPGEIFLLLMI